MCRSHKKLSWEKTTPVAVKIKLKRLGKIRSPYYRVVVADARAKRDGRAIEEIGKYHPMQEPSLIEINSERAQYWLSVGAQPTDPVRNLLKITGDWQRFRGEDGADGTLKTAAPRPGKREAFAEALKEVHGEAGGAATTQKERGRKADAKTDKAEKADKAKAEKTDTRSPRGGKSSRSGGASGKAGGETDTAKAAPEAESGKADADGKAGEAETAARASKTSSRAARGSGKAGVKQGAKQENAADEASSGEPGEPGGPGEAAKDDSAKAGARGSRKRSSGPKAEATSDSSEAGTDEAGSEG
jgi:small subunit ribosomal protein S16